MNNSPSAAASRASTTFTLFAGAVLALGAFLVYNSSNDLSRTRSRQRDRDGDDNLDDSSSTPAPSTTPPAAAGSGEQATAGGNADDGSGETGGSSRRGDYLTNLGQINALITNVMLAGCALGSEATPRKQRTAANILVRRALTPQNLRRLVSNIEQSGVWPAGTNMNAVELQVYSAEILVMMIRHSSGEQYQTLVENRVFTVLLQYMCNERRNPARMRPVLSVFQNAVQSSSVVCTHLATPATIDALIDILNVDEPAYSLEDALLAILTMHRLMTNKTADMNFVNERLPPSLLKCIQRSATSASLLRTAIECLLQYVNMQADTHSKREVLQKLSPHGLARVIEIGLRGGDGVAAGWTVALMNECVQHQTGHDLMRTIPDLASLLSVAMTSVDSYQNILALCVFYNLVYANDPFRVQVIKSHALSRIVSSLGSNDEQSQRIASHCLFHISAITESNEAILAHPAFTQRLLYLVMEKSTASNICELMLTFAGNIRVHPWIINNESIFMKGLEYALYSDNAEQQQIMASVMLSFVTLSKKLAKSIVSKNPVIERLFSIVLNRQDQAVQYSSAKCLLMMVVRGYLNESQLLSQSAVPMITSTLHFWSSAAIHRFPQLAPPPLSSVRRSSATAMTTATAAAAHDAALVGFRRGVQRNSAATGTAGLTREEALMNIDRAVRRSAVSVSSDSSSGWDTSDDEIDTRPLRTTNTTTTTTTTTTAAATAAAAAAATEPPFAAIPPASTATTPSTIITSNLGNIPGESVATPASVSSLLVEWLKDAPRQGFVDQERSQDEQIAEDLAYMSILFRTLRPLITVQVFQDWPMSSSPVNASSTGSSSPDESPILKESSVHRSNTGSDDATSVPPIGGNHSASGSFSRSEYIGLLDDVGHMVQSFLASFLIPDQLVPDGLDAVCFNGDFDIDEEPVSAVMNSLVIQPDDINSINEITPAVPQPIVLSNEKGRSMVQTSSGHRVRLSALRRQLPRFDILLSRIMARRRRVSAASDIGSSFHSHTTESISPLTEPTAKVASPTTSRGHQRQPTAGSPTTSSSLPRIDIPIPSVWQSVFSEAKKSPKSKSLLESKSNTSSDTDPKHDLPKLLAEYTTASIHDGLELLCLLLQYRPSAINIAHGRLIQILVGLYYKYPHQRHDILEIIGLTASWMDLSALRRLKSLLGLLWLDSLAHHRDTEIAKRHAHPPTLEEARMTALRRFGRRLAVENIAGAGGTSVVVPPPSSSICKHHMHIHFHHLPNESKSEPAVNCDHASEMDDPAVNILRTCRSAALRRYPRSLGPLILSNRLEVINNTWTFESILGNIFVTGSGKYCYQVTLRSYGLMQIGWASDRFVPQPIGGQGVGDEFESYAFDGSRRRRWHGIPIENIYGPRYAAGDVITSCIDLDSGEISFYLNGVSLGVAFNNEIVDDARKRLCKPSPSTGDVPVPVMQRLDNKRAWYPAISLSLGQSCLLAFGGDDEEPLKFVPEGFIPVGKVIPQPAVGESVEIEENTPATVAPAVVSEIPPKSPTFYFEARMLLRAYSRVLIGMWIQDSILVGLALQRNPASPSQFSAHIVRLVGVWDLDDTAKINERLDVVFGHKDSTECLEAYSDHNAVLPPNVVNKNGERQTFGVGVAADSNPSIFVTVPRDNNEAQKVYHLACPLSDVAPSNGSSHKLPVPFVMPLLLTDIEQKDDWMAGTGRRRLELAQLSVNLGDDDFAYAAANNADMRESLLGGVV